MIHSLIVFNTRDLYLWERSWVGSRRQNSHFYPTFFVHYNFSEKLLVNLFLLPFTFISPYRVILSRKISSSVLQYKNTFERPVQESLKIFPGTVIPRRQRNNHRVFTIITSRRKMSYERPIYTLITLSWNF